MRTVALVIVTLLIGCGRIEQAPQVPPQPTENQKNGPTSIQLGAYQSCICVATRQRPEVILSGRHGDSIPYCGMIGRLHECPGALDL